MIILIACGSVSRRHLRVNVERTTPYLSAIFCHGIFSHSIKDCNSAIAASIVIVALSYVVEEIGVKNAFGASSARTRYRVRALNARRQSMHAHHQNGLHRIEAVEPHTIAIITG